MATAAFTHKNARLLSTVAATELVRIDAINVTTTRSAAAANHFSCSRSSPDDRANLTTTAATLTASAAGRRIRIAITKDGACEANGCDQLRVALTSAPTMVSANAPPTNQAAGRHRRERSCPVGKSRNTNAITVIGITQVQLASQATTRPAGQDPGAATRARCP